MANVVLTHSALGLDSNIESWAEWLRVEGHQVMLVDLYGGDTFTNLREGHARAAAGKMLDYAAMVSETAVEAEFPLVLMGFSLGAVASEIAALTGPSVAGMLLIGGAAGPKWFGEPRWPAGLRGQLHYAIDDSWMEVDGAADLVAHAPEGALEVFSYPGGSHLFAFPEHADYDALAADTLRTEAKAFLASFEQLVGSDEPASRRLLNPDGRARVRIDVADDGPGMEPEVAARATERFMRGDSSRSRATGGAGLGLAIAAAIVDAHDGALEIESAPGQGTTVSIEFPA